MKRTDRVAGAGHRRRWLIRGALLIAAVLALWSTTETTREQGSLTIDLTLPGWFALVILLYLAAGWYRPRRGGRAASAGIEQPAAAEPDSAHPPPGVPANTETPPAPEPLIVRSGNATHVVDVARIRWVAAEGRYARLWLPDGSILSQYSISQLAARLDGKGFARVHRSRIVNLDAVRALRSRGARDAEVVLMDGTRIPVSRTQRPALERLLGIREGRVEDR